MKPHAEDEWPRTFHRTKRSFVPDRLWTFAVNGFMNSKKNKGAWVILIAFLSKGDPIL